MFCDTIYIMINNITKFCEKLMKVLFMMLVALTISILLNGCAVYKYKRTSDTCSLSIYSMRDIIAGDLRISKSCALTGGADSLTANQQAMEAITGLVNKIP